MLVLSQIQNYQWWLLALMANSVLFAMAFGACVGSLTNVLVYRLPRGLDVVSPPSACPSCGTRLTWRENIPIFGWLLLRGRCRFCRDRISPEYPIVEAFVALLFGVFYFLVYSVQDIGGPLYNPQFLGINWGAIAPPWGELGFARTWPLFITLMIVLSCLVAMTLVDAKTFTIPLILAWIPTGVAVLVHPVYAAVVHGSTSFPPVKGNWTWIISGPAFKDWFWIAGSIGAVAGLVIGNLMVKFNLLKRSFADYDEWEKKALAEQGREAPTDPSQAPVDMWVQYPFARREAFKELLFLAPCLGLGVGCGYLADHLWGPKLVPTVLGMVAQGGVRAPMWLVALTSVLLGYLIGGGIVWAVRLLGTIALNKEAMGLGDVHLLAAVGACLGWVDSVLAFFGAAFVGLAWAILGRVFSGKLKMVLPYGPYLAVATLLVLLFKPAIELGLTRLFQMQTPIQIP